MVDENAVRDWDGDVESGVVGLDTAVTKRGVVQSTPTITRSGHQTYGSTLMSPRYQIRKVLSATARASGNA